VREVGDAARQVPIPFSVTRRNYLANLQASISPPLTEQDMKDIAAIDKNCRLIKGQVFLWKENQTWEDLWDVNGVIHHEEDERRHPAGQQHVEFRDFESLSPATDRY